MYCVRPKYNERCDVVTPIGSSSSSDDDDESLDGCDCCCCDPKPKTFSRCPVFGSIKNHVSLFLPEYKIPSLERHGALATNCGIV